MSACAQVLRKPGRAVALAVGGAEESLLSRPRTLNLVLKKRQGFVKIALQAGMMPHVALKVHIKFWLQSAQTAYVLCSYTVYTLV